MREAHLTAADLEQILEDENEVRNRLFLHHLAVCPECYAVGGYILDLYLAGELSLDLCTVEINIARSRREAPALWQELHELPLEKQRALAGNDGRFWSWGLCELLCEESEREAPRDPKRAIERAELAVAIASTLRDWEPAEPHWRDELHALALAQLANAHRALGTLPEAEAALASADQLWGPANADVGDVLGYESKYLALKASLWRAERRLPEALGLLEKALGADPRPPLRVRILINQAKVHEELGDIGRAIAVLDDARTQTDEGVDARIRLCLAQNRLDYLSKAGRFLEAQFAYPEVEALAAESGSNIDRLRLHWTKARIAKGLGRAAEALQILEGVRQGFASETLGYDVALSSLELALMYAEAGRTVDVVGALQKALPILGSLKIEREGLMAVRILTAALEEGSVTAELISQVLDRLRLDTDQLIA